MNVYLAGLEGYFLNSLLKEYVHQNPALILGSYYSISQRNPKRYCEQMPYFKDFMLDSGAFTFMNSGCHENWESYIERYADFIKKNDVKKFFELDIDSIIGYDKVKEYRYRLERLIGWQSIPVWHILRGKEEFTRMCAEYSYVSIGGIVTKEIPPNKYKLFSILIKEAHKNKVKIHGLGFTNLALLKEYHFDSVDSTSWLSGGRFGTVYKFMNGSLRSVKRKDGTRLIDYKSLDARNFREWLKFQKYAETHL